MPVPENAKITKRTKNDPYSSKFYESVDVERLELLAAMALPEIDNASGEEIDKECEDLAGTHERDTDTGSVTSAKALKNLASQSLSVIYIRSGWKLTKAECLAAFEALKEGGYVELLVPLNAKPVPKKRGKKPSQ